MQGSEPSRTAMGAAAYRAAHQVADGGSVFQDPYARAIVGEEACAAADQDAANPQTRPLRMFMAARSKYADDCLGGLVEEGTRQVVVLGAGLDTLGLRNPYADIGLHVFEVDHPATQIWKRERLKEAQLSPRGALTFVPVDFEEEDLADCLANAGFRADSPAFFIWLGVVPYLQRESVFAILRFVGGLPRSSIVFDYGEPLENYPPERRARVAGLGARAAAAGEPWLTQFDPEDLARELKAFGFRHIEDLGPTGMARRFFGAPENGPDRGAGPHVIWARR